MNEIKQKQFIEELINTGNRTMAAVKVSNISSRGGSETEEAKRHTASELGRRMLKEVENHPILTRFLIKLMIDRNNRLRVLAKILHGKDKRAAIEANKEITKMLGEYAPNQIQINNAYEAREAVLE